MNRIHPGGRLIVEAGDVTVGRRATRQAIVEAADQLFYAQGFEHTSFADIAAVVNISRGNFYHHFKTKDEILGAVINLRLEQTGLMLERWEAEGKTPVDRIRSFIHIVIANQKKDQAFSAALSALCSSNLQNSTMVPSPVRGKTLFPVPGMAPPAISRCSALRRKADELAVHLLGSSQGVCRPCQCFPG